MTRKRMRLSGRTMHLFYSAFALYNVISSSAVNGQAEGIISYLFESTFKAGSKNSQLSLQRAKLHSFPGWRSSRISHWSLVLFSFQCFIQYSHWERRKQPTQSDSLIARYHHSSSYGDSIYPLSTRDFPMIDNCLCLSQWSVSSAGFILSLNHLLLMQIIAF